MSLRFVVVVLALASCADAVKLRSSSSAQVQANPIRKVVTLLQAMQKKVAAEGDEEKELYEKFMCYCKTGGGDLSESIGAAEVKAPQLVADIEAAEGKLAQAKEDLKQAQTDRGAAKDAMAQATAIREKEAASYAAFKAEADTNIAAVAKAVAALEKGMAGSFLQTPSAKVLLRLVQGQKDSLDVDTKDVLSFLSGTEGYAPQGGQITGILKQMGDTLAAGLADATSEEESAVKGYEGILAAKKKEAAALTEAIEAKTKLIGELGIEIVTMKEDLDDTSKAMMEDKKFLAELEKGCGTKTAEWEERSKVRATELVALADTIKVLNDDDALDLFKRTLPGASASFVQVKVSSSLMRSRALAAILEARKAGLDKPRLDLISLALNGKKIGFEKVVAMIDEMVKNLSQEQVDDDSKKEYCAAQLDLADDKKKGLERSIADKETAIAAAKEAIATLAEEIAALKAGIAALDKDVAEATEQRKQENADYSDLMASDSAAKEVLGFAKNRLNKYYNPKLYKAPPKRELSAEDRIAVNLGGGTAPPTPPPGGIAGTGITVFAQVTEHVREQHKDAPPPPPETFGPYTKKTGENTGVIAMIDLLIKDLDKEMTEAETTEKDSQADYEALMKDSADKRTADSKSLTEKEAAKADTEALLEKTEEEKGSADKELGATLQYVASLHAECDWLVQYYDVRKEARASEVDALGKAKAVLSGADFSLVQRRTGHLRRTSLQ